MALTVDSPPDIREAFGTEDGEHDLRAAQDRACSAVSVSALAYTDAEQPPYFAHVYLNSLSDGLVWAGAISRQDRWPTSEEIADALGRWRGQGAPTFHVHWWQDKTVFISGHMDLTAQEFEEHYAPRLRDVVATGAAVVVGDARGADTMAQRYLKAARHENVLVYHMLATPRFNADFPTVGGFASDRERDEAMTRASSSDIAWVRPGREKSGTAKNLARRAQFISRGMVDPTVPARARRP